MSHRNFPVMNMDTDGLAAAFSDSGLQERVEIAQYSWFHLAIGYGYRNRTNISEM